MTPMELDPDVVLERADSWLSTIGTWPLFERSGVVPFGVTVLTPADGVRLVESELRSDWYLQQQGRMSSAVADQLVTMGFPNVFVPMKVWTTAADHVRPRIIGLITERAWETARPGEAGATAVLPMVQWDLLHLAIEIAMDFDFGPEASYRWSVPIYRAGYVAAVRTAGKERKRLVDVCAF